jgi:hypothetical protein
MEDPLPEVPQPAREPAPSHPTVIYRVPPSERTPQGSGWRAHTILKLNSTFLDTEVLRRLYALCSPARLTVANTIQMKRAVSTPA